MAILRKEIKPRVRYTFGLICYLYSSRVLRHYPKSKDTATTSRKYAHIPSGANWTTDVMVSCL